jgi:hypothetical protein
VLNVSDRTHILPKLPGASTAGAVLHSRLTIKPLRQTDWHLRAGVTHEEPSACDQGAGSLTTAGKRFASTKPGAESPF